MDAFTLEMDEVAEHQFEKEDDGCMSLAAHPIKKSFFAGVNCSADIVKMGDNINARFFYIQNKRYLNTSFNHPHDSLLKSLVVFIIVQNILCKH